MRPQTPYPSSDPVSGRDVNQRQPGADCRTRQARHRRAKRARGGRTIPALLGALAVALCIAPGADAQVDPARRRGRYLRTDVVNTETKPTFTCTLARVQGATPVLRFRKQQRVTFHELRLYEVLVLEESPGGEMEPDTATYRLIPGEEMAGERSSREVVRDTGPFANATFQVGDEPITTDAEGLYVDRQQHFLLPFDDLTVSRREVIVTHADRGSILLELTRFLTRRWSDEERQDRLQMAQTDLLKALDLDYEPLSTSDHSGLKLALELPEVVVPGETIVITVTATNTGSKPVSCLLGRLFSRHPWLNQINVYIGNVQPGTSRDFSRRIRIPAGLSSDLPVYAALGFWDIRGPIKGAARRIRLVPSPPE